MKSHLVCVALGGCIPFCGLPCLPVIWLWSFIYFPGFKKRRRAKVYIYFIFQVVGLYYWWKVLVRCQLLSQFDRTCRLTRRVKSVQNNHFVDAFLLSFGTSHGYIVISAGIPTGVHALFQKFAIMLVIANLVNCFLGAFGSLHVVCSRNSPEEEAPIMVVRATAVDSVSRIFRRGVDAPMTHTVVRTATVRAGPSPNAPSIRCLTPGQHVAVLETRKKSRHLRARVGPGEWVSERTAHGNILLVPYAPQAQPYSVVATVTVRKNKSVKRADLKGGTWVREIKAGATVAVLEECTAGGHHRARIGVDEWISLRTEKGSVLATPTTVVVDSEPFLVPIVVVQGAATGDTKGKKAAKKGKKAAKKGKKHTKQDLMSNPVYDDGED